MDSDRPPADPPGAAEGPAAGGPPADRPMDELRAAIGDDFDVIRRLGQGSMAAVYLARDKALGVLVAIKVLRPGRAADETARRRFEREARAAASLSEHPNVVAVHRFGRLPDETPYLVMQFVKGRTIEERLKAEGKLPLAEAKAILLEVASALEVAHGKGIVHRDVRPGNIMWDEEKRKALITDFGIAAILATGGEDTTRLTKTGQILGNPRYLSPEQLRDEDLTELADMYVFGVLGYELISGQGPYDAKSNAEWISAHLIKEPLDLAELRPGVPAELASLLKRCMSREPMHRPSAADVVRALKNEPQAAGAAIAGGGAAAGHPDDVAELVRRRVPQIVGLAVAVSVAMIGVASDLQGGFLPDYALAVALVTSAALVVASGVVAWFHGEKGRQRAPTIEYVMLGVVAVVWILASSWIALSS